MADYIGIIPIFSDSIISANTLDTSLYSIDNYSILFEFPTIEGDLIESSDSITLASTVDALLYNVDNYSILFELPTTEGFYVPDYPVINKIIEPTLYRDLPVIRGVLQGQSFVIGTKSKLPLLEPDMQGKEVYLGIRNTSFPAISGDLREVNALRASTNVLKSVINNLVNLYVNLIDIDSLSITPQIINVVPINFTSTPITNVYENNQYTYKPLAVSCYSTVITYSLTVKPVWLSITNGVLRGYPSNTGSHTVSIEASDSYDIATQEFTIIVTTIEKPPLTPTWSIGNPDKQIMLAIINSFNKTKQQEEILYFGTEGYVSYPTDSPSNTSFEGYIKEIVRFSHSISAAIDASSDISRGRLVLQNSTGYLDRLITENTFGYRTLKLFLGNPKNQLSTFKLLLDGVIDRNGMSITKDDIQFEIFDKRKLLEIPVQKELLKDEVYPPIAFGKCFNITGVLIDEINLVYKLNFTSIKSVIDVKDAGASFTRLKVEGFNDYTIDLENATVTLVSPPFGEVTFDIEGTVEENGSYPETAPDILKYLILNFTKLTEDDIDIPSFSYLNTICNQKLGYYSQDKVTVHEILIDLFSTIGSYLIVKRDDGKLKAIHFDNPSTEYRLEIKTGDIKQDGFYPNRVISPIESLSMGYKRNYTVIDRNSQATVAFIPTTKSIELSKEWANRVFLKNKNILTTYADATPFDENDSSVEGIIPSSFINYIDAWREGLRRINMYGFQRIVYTLEGYDSLYQLEVGDVVKVTHPRYGFNQGVLVTVINIEETTDGINLEVLR